MEELSFKCHQVIFRLLFAHRKSFIIFL